MKAGSVSQANRRNRRNFLKSQFILGISALTSRISFSGICTSDNQEDNNPEVLRKHYQDCLGGSFPDPCPLNLQVREIIKKDGYRIESITYEVQPGDRVPAYLLIPDKATKAHPVPGIAVWHQHNGQFYLGKTEPAGLAGNPMHHTGVALVHEGYVVICPDALCFGERQDPTSILKDANFERFEFLRQVVRGRSLAWKNILDMKRAIDVLCGRVEVIPDKLGCYGHSMGSTHSWLLGPLEPRLKCIVGNCCLPTYEAIEEEHLLHCFPNFVPGWKKYGDTPEIASLIAPRALHLNFGDKDTGSPIGSVKRGLERITEVYKKSGAAGNFTYFIEPDKGHVLSELMWKHTNDCFTKHLKNGNPV